MFCSFLMSIEEFNITGRKISTTDTTVGLGYDTSSGNKEN